MESSSEETAPMPKIRTSLYTILFRGLATLIIALVSHPASAIVTRHDRDDARYVALGAQFPAAVTVLPDGSGVLIAPNWVLTAGHVARGVAKRSPRVEIDGREHEVARVFVHPKWQEMGPHDVGLLQLTSLAQRVTPAELYTADDEVGQVVTFVGRGDTGTGLTGPQTADGKKRGATNRVESADDDWIIFNFDEGDDATDLEGVSGPGDSGGPALLIREGKVYTLGVSVFSDGRGKGPGRYGVLEGYTRVSTHRGWIESIVSGKSGDGEVDMGAVAVPIAGSESAKLPDSPVGTLVAKYVEAYNSNSDAAMSAFITTHFEKSFRESKSEREHLDLYRRLYDEHFGPLVVDRVVREEEAGLTVLFRSAKGPMAEFGFEVGAGKRKRIAGIRVAVVDVRGGPAEQGKPQRAIEELDWIVGTWKRESRRGEIYESWKRLSDRTVEGDSWIVSSTDGTEHPLESLLLVEMAGELFYIPKVAENEYPVPFRRTSMESGRVVFENPTHDFPQRIIYQRIGDDGLKVTIEGPVDGGESRQVDFHFRRAE
jgi:hypothetical protein